MSKTTQGIHAYCLFRAIEWPCAICTGLASPNYNDTLVHYL